ALPSQLHSRGDRAARQAIGANSTRSTRPAPPERGVDGSITGEAFVKLVDIIIIAVYAVSIFGLAQWVSREKGTHKKDAQDYFLASRALPWWAIGTSLIAANISAEQIIGMSGSGYVIGLGIASYEWMAAITLIIVGKYFLPIFLKNSI